MSNYKVFIAENRKSVVACAGWICGITYAYKQ